MERFYLKSLEHGTIGRQLEKNIVYSRHSLESSQFQTYSRLHAAQYCAKETDHAQVFNNIDCFNGQLLQDCRHRKQYRAAETKHIADELILS